MRPIVRTLVAVVLATAYLSVGANAQPAPAVPVAATASPKAMFLIRGPDGNVTAVRTIAAQKQGAVLVLTTPNGSRAVVETRAIAGQAPWYTDEELRSAVNLPALIVTYETLVLRFPSARKFLDGEIARFRAIIKAREDEAAAQKKAEAERVATVVVATYDPTGGYTIEKLQEMLRHADETSAAVPQAANRIEQWAKPFREHLEKLQAGNLYVNGEWLTPEELAHRDQAAREAAFLKSLDYEIDKLVLPSADVHKIVSRASTATGVAALAGLGLILFARSRRAWRTTGLVLLVGAPFTLAAFFFLATRTPILPPDATGPIDAQPVVTALAEAAEVAPGSPAKEHVISEQAINAFFARYVRMKPIARTHDWTATREAIVVRLNSGRLSIFELVRCAGLDWIVRYDLSFPSGAEAKFGVSGVKIGALECPAGLAGSLWKSLESQLVALLTTSKLNDRFTPQSPAPEAITLTPTKTASSALAPSPQAPPPSPSASAPPSEASPEVPAASPQSDLPSPSPGATVAP